MEKKNKMTLILSVAVCLLPMILGAILYNKLPEQMPIHFTIKSDMPDNYAPKAFAVFGIPIIMAIVQAICIIITSKTSSATECKKPKVLKMFEWIIPFLTSLFYIITLKVALENNFYAVRKSVCLILGILFMIIGNYLPKMSYESGKKIFHPIQKNEKSFRKISKIMGYSFVGVGILLLILMIFV